MRLNPEARVVVLSGQNDQANIQHALTLGAVDFVAKPCDGHVLHGRLSHQSMLLDAERATRRPAVQSDELVGTSEAIAAARGDQTICEHAVPCPCSRRIRYR